MSAPKKQCDEPEETGIDDNDMEDNDSEDDMDASDNETNSHAVEKIQVDFVARCAEDCDFHGIRILMEQLFLKANVDLSELTNTVLSQNYVGSVLMQSDLPEGDGSDDDDDNDTIFAVNTVVNITERKELAWVKQLKSLLQSRCSKSAPSKLDRLTTVLDDPGGQVGFVISERYINIPAQISLPMFQSLVKEMDRASAKNMKYKFDWYLLVCKTYRQKVKKKKHQQQANPQLYFTNEEEEFFTKHADLSFSYSVENERDTIVSGRWDLDDEMEPLRTVFLLPANKFEDVLAQMKEEIPPA